MSDVAGVSKGRAARAVLIGVIALHLVAETALGPFYPELFRRLFDVHDLAATGTYVWVARVAGLLALPLWGLAARRWPLHRLVVTGLWAAAVLDLALGFAPSWAWFTGLTAAVVAVQSALLLAYPAYVGLVEERGDRLAAVRTYVLVLHAAMAGSALIGAGVLLLPNPRVGISAFALVDVVMALLCAKVLASGPVRRGSGEPTIPAGSRPRARHVAVAVLAVAGVATLFDLAANVSRPFFTEYAFSGGASITGAAILFLLPSAAVCAVLPVVRPLSRRLGAALLPVGLVLAGAGLALQAATPDVGPLVVGRLLLGAGLGVAHVGLDLRVFAITGTAGPAFTVVETLRTVALLVLPVLATAAASVNLALPLAAGALLFAVTVPLSLVTATGRTTPGPTPSPVPPTSEESLAPLPPH